MDKLEYGLVKEYTNYDLWFEPITDEIDGFVIKDKDGLCILSVFTNKDKGNDFTWDGSGD